jgi:hypothetical protein
MGPDDEGPSRRTPTPETVAMRNLRSFSRGGGSRRWYTSCWVPIIGALVVILLVLMVAV